MTSTETRRSARRRPGRSGRQDRLQLPGRGEPPVALRCEARAALVVPEGTTRPPQSVDTARGHLSRTSRAGFSAAGLLHEFSPRLTHPPQVLTGQSLRAYVATSPMKNALTLYDFQGSPCP